MKHNQRTQTRKPDRLTNPGASACETITHYALGPFDAACRDMDRKWGIDRLPQIVSPDMAAIWGQTMANLNTAITAGFSGDDQARVRADVSACVESALRGFRAMDAAAEAAGQPKADPRVWEYELDGIKIGIMADDCAWQSIKDKRPDLMLFTMREVARELLHQRDPMPEMESPQKEGSFKSKLPKGFFQNGGDEIAW